MKDELKVQSEYWTKEANAFESIYSGKKSKFSLFLDRIFRKDMFQRYEFTINNCEPAKGRTFYDVGSGNGKYSIELAKRGAQKVTGLDISEKMVNISQKNAESEKVANTCTFIIGEPLTFETKNTFDVAIGIGLFDYIKDALPVLIKMNEAAKDKIIVSFPRFWTWRAPVRKLRLFLRGCPVYFYRKTVIEKLMLEAGFRETEIHVIGKLFCVIGKK